jgi:hypothetical protein
MRSIWRSYQVRAEIKTKLQGLPVEKLRTFVSLLGMSNAGYATTDNAIEWIDNNLSSLTPSQVEIAAETAVELQEHGVLLGDLRAEISAAAKNLSEEIAILQRSTKETTDQLSKDIQHQTATLSTARDDFDKRIQAAFKGIDTFRFLIMAIPLLLTVLGGYAYWRADDKLTKLDDARQQAKDKLDILNNEIEKQVKRAEEQESALYICALRDW